MGFINIEQLVALRTAKGWDQKQLAEAAGVDRSVISRLERGLQLDCRVSVLVGIATALQAPIKLLLPNTNGEELPELSTELAIAIIRLKEQAITNQFRAALIMNAFLDGLDKDNS